MGVLTTAYSIPLETMKKIQGYKRHLEKIFNAEADWRFEKYDFDKSWDEKIRIIGKCYPRTRNRLHHEKYWKYPDRDVWIVKPKEVKFVADDLARTTFEGLQKWALKGGVRDYWGEIIPEELYPYFIGDIENFKLFLRKAAEIGNYLLFETS
jgi:hypothetical protein